MADIRQKLVTKIKMLHKIPPEDQLDIENEVFLDYFSKEILQWVEENTDELKWKEEDGDKQDEI